MIGRIRGILLEKHPPTVCVETYGVGYDIDVPMTTFYDLPAVGAEVILHTHLAIRDDAHILYGFSSVRQRHAFRTLIRVTGVGARTALAVLSGMTVDELTLAVAQQEADRLLKVPGIGKKTAERLLLELRDKLGDLPAVDGKATSLPGAGPDDVSAALAALGYSTTEIRKAVKNLPKDTDTSEGIRLALQALSRS